jgi:hypothetical protein
MWRVYVLFALVQGKMVLAQGHSHGKTILLWSPAAITQLLFLPAPQLREHLSMEILRLVRGTTSPELVLAAVMEGTAAMQAAVLAAIAEMEVMHQGQVVARLA